MAYKIANDPSASDDTIAFPGLARQFAIDSQIVTAALVGTYWGSGSIGNSDPALWSGTTNTTSFTPGTTSTLPLTSGSALPASGYVYITKADGSNWAKVAYTSNTSGTLGGLTCTGPGVGVAFASGSTVSSPTVIGAAGYFNIQGTSYVTTIGFGADYTATAPDTIYDRIDLVYMDSSGVYTILAGTPSPNPVPPTLNSLVDSIGNLNVLPVGLIYLPANATTFTLARNWRSLIIRRGDMLGVSTVANASFTAYPNATRYVLYTSLSASRVVTLPLANSVPAGYSMTVADGSGNCTPSVLITIKANSSGGTDTLNGVLNTNGGYALNGPYQSATVTSDGSSSWVVTNATRRSGTLSGTVVSTVLSSTSATVDLITHTVPANTFQVNGDSLRARSVILFAGNANSKVITVKFGGTTLFTYTTTFGTAHDIEVDIEIVRTGGTTGRAIFRATTGATSLATFSVTQPNHNLLTSKDWTTALDYVITSSIQTATTDVQAVTSKGTWSPA